MEKENNSRRNFLTSTAPITATSVILPSVLSGCYKKPVEVALPTMLDQSPDGPVFNVRISGCGGRGTGAANNFLHVGPDF